MAVKFKRVLLKISGEQLSGNTGTGIDSNFINDLAENLKTVAQHGVEVAVVVGGGNFARGKDLKVKGLKAVTGHYMGMAATMINGMALVDVLESHGQPAHLQTTLHIENLTVPFNEVVASKHLKNKEVLVIMGGTGKPNVTTDTAAVNFAIRLGCDVVLKATKVDGVYDKDPKEYKDAKRYSSLSHKEAFENPDIEVMDKTALLQAMKNKMPIIVFKLMPITNIKKVIQGENLGTRVIS